MGACASRSAAPSSEASATHSTQLFTGNGRAVRPRQLSRENLELFNEEQSWRYQKGAALETLAATSQEESSMYQSRESDRVAAAPSSEAIQGTTQAAMPEQDAPRRKFRGANHRFSLALSAATNPLGREPVSIMHRSLNQQRLTGTGSRGVNWRDSGGSNDSGGVVGRKHRFSRALEQAEAASALCHEGMDDDGLGDWKAPKWRASNFGARHTHYGDASASHRSDGAVSMQTHALSLFDDEVGDGGWAGAAQNRLDLAPNTQGRTTTV